MDKGVVAHMRGGEEFACEVGNRTTYLVMNICDETTFLTVQGMTDLEGNNTAVAVVKEVW